MELAFIGNIYCELGKCKYKLFVIRYADEAFESEYPLDLVHNDFPGNC